MRARLGATRASVAPLLLMAHAAGCVQEQWVSEFAEQWDDYDWTKQLA